jgi:(2Fe-2S) ferredoxin
VYPDDVWYQYIDEEDVDEIIDSHLMGGKEVKRLKIK